MTLDVRSSDGEAPRATVYFSPDLALGPVPLAKVGAMIEDLAAVRGSLRDVPDADASPVPDTRLHSFDTPLGPSDGMRDARLRLVLELTDDAGGGTYARLRQFDQTVDYGPINVQDLPFLIEALLDEPVQVGSPLDG